jgi:hypothetical protein
VKNQEVTSEGILSGKAQLAVSLIAAGFFLTVSD